MMKQRIIGVVLAALLLAGCSAGTYAPGSYSAEAAGFGGALTVEVTFSAEEITDVTVIEHNETPDLADDALAEIPQAIVEAQSSDVDSVSGATMTSEAIKAAVRDCIDQAQKG